MQQEYSPIVLPELPFSPNALEPVLIGEILQVHHGKHHKKYVDEYNIHAQDLVSKIYAKDVAGAQKIADKVWFNGGGHQAHAWYWENLAPADNGGGILPDDKSNLTHKIVQTFGSYDNFMKLFNAKAAPIQGSGWCWLSYCPITKGLCIKETQNQDLISTEGGVPLLTVDVWEHAYYLQYKNLRPDYLQNIWKVINWRCVEDRFNKATNFEKL